MPEMRSGQRFDRIAWAYDYFLYPMERLGMAKTRCGFLSGVHGKVLEVGIGTGLNLPCYPPDIELTGIDVSPRMMERAETRAVRLGLAADLRLMDVERLEFPEATFDYVVATLVFCSVDDPVRGLKELGRVTKPDGEILLIEHVRSDNPLLGRLMDLGNRLTRPVMGEDINRRTVELAREAGLQLVSVESGPVKILKKITARPPA